MTLEKIDYPEKCDWLTNEINSFLNLPDTRVDLLVKYLIQNKGKLSKRKGQKDFVVYKITLLLFQGIAPLFRSFLNVFPVSRSYRPALNQPGSYRLYPFASF